MPNASNPTLAAICTDECTHPYPFNLAAGDRSARTLDAANDLAERRKDRPAEQQIGRHVSHLFKTGIYFVQDAR